MAVMTKSALYSRIESMRKKYGIEGPFDPLAFTKANGYVVAAHRFDDDNVKGFLIRIPGTPFKGIALNERLTSAERRCVIAHELVHSELHGTRSRVYEVNLEPSHYKEYQADEGAAELILPYRDFIPRVCAMKGFLNSRPSLAIAQLAKYYGVDCEYIRKRLKALTYELHQYEHGVPLDGLRLESAQSRTERGVALPPLMRKGVLPGKFNADIWADEC